jgi:hypothetical protein
MASSTLPLYPVYRWPGLAGLAVTAPATRFAFEELCAGPRQPDDARDYAVAARATVAQPVGQWQLQGQIVHWRGDTAYTGPTASTVLQQATARLRACQATAPLASASVTTLDADRVAAVISVAGQQVMRQYLVAHPASGTVVELALWSTLPPQVPWSGQPDAEILDAMAAPLCGAYLGSCR